MYRTHMITSKMMSKRKQIKRKSLHLSLAMLQLGGKLDPNNRTVNGPEQSHLIPWGDVRAWQANAYPSLLYTISQLIQGFSLALASKKASRSNLGSSKSVITERMRDRLAPCIRDDRPKQPKRRWSSTVLFGKGSRVTYIHLIVWWSPAWAGSSSCIRPWPARSSAPCGRTRAQSPCAWRPG